MGDCPARGVSHFSEIAEWPATTRNASPNPLLLVDKADRLVLEGLGYTFEKDGEVWYLFAPGGENSTAWGIDPNDWLGGVRCMLTAGCGTSCLDGEARRADPSGYRRGPGLGWHDWP